MSDQDEFKAEAEIEESQKKWEIKFKDDVIKILDEGIGTKSLNQMAEEILDVL